MAILAGERLYIEADQMLLDGALILTENVKALGGTVLGTREGATGILVNPAHPSFSAASYPPSPPQIYYTWPAHCAAAGTRVDPATLPFPVLLNHWRPKYQGAPATVYVSVNLRRTRADEEPRATKAAVERALAPLGALIVTKRSRADIMVVDRKTSFFLDKITGEATKAGRDWQRFAEREWAEAVIREGRMMPLQNLAGEVMPVPEEGPQPGPAPRDDEVAPPGSTQASEDAEETVPPADETASTAVPTEGVEPTDGAENTDVDMDGEGAVAAQPVPIIRPPSQREREEEARRQREDSFAEDEEADASFKKAPGRRAGQPRNEYTPEDDDLLCRYLARHHVGGSWNSRKTYQMMVERREQYPWVTNHTWQSWLERFKKNSVAFSHRIKKYMLSGLDDALRTSTQRQAARAGASQKGKALVATTDRAAQASTGKGKGKEPADDGAGAGDSGNSEGERMGSQKRRLVVSDDDDDEPRKKEPPRLALGRNRPGSGFPTRAPESSQREPPSMPGPSASGAPATTVHGQGEIAAGAPPAEPAAPPSPPRAPMEPVVAVVEAVTVTVVEAVAVVEAPAVPSALEQPEPQQVEELPPTQQPPQQSGQPTEQQQETQHQPEKQVGELQPEPQVPSAQQPAAQEEPSEPAPPTPTPVPAAAAHAPPTPAPPTPVPPTPAPLAVPASPQTPAPSQAPPSAQPQPPASPASYAPRPSAVADLIDRRRTPRRPRHTLATVSAPYAQHTPSRRRVLDTVSVSPGQLRTPAPPPREFTPTHAPPPLTPEQLQQRLEAGRSIVTSAAQTYRGYIDRWLDVFGVGQAEIMAAVEEVRARTDLKQAPLVFGEVERVLEERYGRA